MSHHKSWKTLGLCLLVLISLAFLTRAVLTQENPARTADKQAAGLQTGSRDETREDAAAAGFASQLRSLRRSGDEAGAAAVFALLFPEGVAIDPGADVKLAEVPPSIVLSGARNEAKPQTAGSPSGLVMSTIDDEKHPTVDMKRDGDDAGSVFVAAEQWADGAPRFVRIGKSSDRGTTWPVSVLLDDGSPWSPWGSCLSEAGWILTVTSFSPRSRRISPRASRGLWP
jgi:hypothetical protein